MKDPLAAVVIITVCLVVALRKSLLWEYAFGSKIASHNRRSSFPAIDDYDMDGDGGLTIFIEEESFP